MKYRDERKESGFEYSGDEVAAPTVTAGTFAVTSALLGAAASCNAYNVHLHYYYSTIRNTYDTHNLE